jgi:hypothetical protein
MYKLAALLTCVGILAGVWLYQEWPSQTQCCQWCPDPERPGSFYCCSVCVK